MDDDGPTVTETKTPSTKTRRRKTRKESSMLDNLKREWALFWAGFQGPWTDAEQIRQSPETLTPEQLKNLKKSLSEERKKLYQGLEQVKEEIDLLTEKRELLKSRGESEQEILAQLSELHDRGQKISEDLARVDHRLKLTRSQESFQKKRSEAMA